MDRRRHRDSGVSTDFQRTVCVRRTREFNAPVSTRRTSNIARHYSGRPIKAMKPTVVRVEIDANTRKILEETGSEGPLRGTGHAIGFLVQDIRRPICLVPSKRSRTLTSLKMEKGQTLSSQPVVSWPYEGVGEVCSLIEDEVVMTAPGSEHSHEP